MIKSGRRPLASLTHQRRLDASLVGQCGHAERRLTLGEGVEEADLDAKSDD